MESEDQSSEEQEDEKQMYTFKLFKNNNGQAVGDALIRRGNWVEVNSLQNFF